MTKALDWRKLPDLVFNDVMLIVGHQSIEDLDSCRQVCRTWNAMIMNKIWENPTKKWGTVIQRRIERSWGPENYPMDKNITYAKSLGKHRVST